VIARFAYIGGIVDHSLIHNGIPQQSV